MHSLQEAKGHASESPALARSHGTPRPAAPTLVAFGTALVPILFAYGGWQNANYIAEEIENPQRNLPLSLVAGTVAVVVIYVSVNAVYLRALGLEGLATTTTPASTRSRWRARAACCRRGTSASMTSATA